MDRHLAKRTALAILAAIVMAPAVWAQTPADNTKVNTRDREKGAVTADQQKQNKADMALTQSIRKAVMKDKSLSTYAHNVKIISQDGQVTLKGPVRSEAEKKTIADAATRIAGEGHVINDISVAAAPPAKR